MESEAGQVAFAHVPWIFKPLFLESFWIGGRQKSRKNSSFSSRFSLLNFNCIHLFWKDS